MIDSPLVTSLYDKKSRWGGEGTNQLNHYTVAQRGDALSDSQQQQQQHGPKERHTELRFICLKKPALLNFFCLREFFYFEDVQPRCFILRSVLPTRARFLIDLTLFFSFRTGQDLTRTAAGENMCERRSAKGMGCLWSPKEKQRGLNTN